MAYLYGVFGSVERTVSDHSPSDLAGKTITVPIWCMVRNLRRAKRIARNCQGYVTRMPLPTTRSWDAPTFRVCSDLVADYRK